MLRRRHDLARHRGAQFLPASRRNCRRFFNSWIRRYSAVAPARCDAARFASVTVGTATSTLVAETRAVTSGEDSVGKDCVNVGQNLTAYLTYAPTCAEILPLRNPAPITNSVSATRED